MFSTRRLFVVMAAIALGLGTWASAAQAAILGGEDYNGGTGNTAGLTYTQGGITIGEDGDDKAWSFGPINWIEMTDATSGSVFLRALVQRELANVDWGGISFFNDDQNDEIMYFGAATSVDPEARAFFGFHDQESGDQAAWSVYFDVGTTHLMVGELDIDNSLARIWVDPAFGIAPPPAFQ